MYQYVKTYTENGAGYIILNDPKKLKDVYKRQPEKTF